MIGFKSNYLKYKDVIKILEKELNKYHYASRDDIAKRNAVYDAIHAINMHHLKNNPRKYLKTEKVYNNNALAILEYEKSLQSDSSS